MKMVRMAHLLVPLAVLFLLGCTDAETKTTREKKEVPVEVIEVQKKLREEVIHLLGTVEADREMKMGFKIGGKIKRLAFKEGQLVKKGKLLAELDMTELLAQKEKAIENMNKTKRDMERMEKLYKENIIPQNSFQDARSLFITAKADIKIVEDSLENSIIRAPFTGRIIKKMSEVGEIVGPGAPVAILTEMNPILVKAAVPDNIVPKIRTGHTIHVRVDTCPGKRFKGVINRMETAADPLSRTFRMEIRLANPGEKLRPGLIAQVEIVHRDKEPAMFIPLDAVIGLGTSPAVFVVKGLTAERRDLKTGKISGEDVEVLEGLSVGEMLVVSGQEYLKDKQRVMIDRKEVEKR